MSRRRSGFTLIELLVVIAIILVLAAILFPVLAAAQKAAQKTTCSSNMKQLAIGIANYCSDWGGKTPMGCAITFAGLNGRATGYNATGDTTWTGNDGTGKIGIYRYIKNGKLFVCPTVNDTMKTYFPQSGGKIITTYALNFRFSAGGANCPPNPLSSSPYVGQTQTLDAPPQPSRTILLVESMSSSTWLGDTATPYGTPPNGGGCVIYSDQGVYGKNIRWFDYPQVPFGHSGGCNMAFADGHVKFIKAPKVGAGYPAYPPTKDADSVICQNNITWWTATLN